MQFRKYTQEQFVQAIANSHSIAQALVALGVAPHGGNYRVAKGYIKKLNLDVSHMTGQSHNKGKNFGPKRPIEDYLNNIVKIASHSLKLRLLKERYFEHRCSVCKLTRWIDQVIPLELDHINGNSEDNTLTNLRLLCPNCHAQTSTYRGKNIKSCSP